VIEDKESEVGVKGVSAKRIQLGHLICRQGWAAANVWMNQGILSGGITLRQNGLVAGLLLILILNKKDGSLAPDYMTPSLIAKLRVLLGDK
jgi:hypothetical protein